MIRELAALLDAVPLTVMPLALAALYIACAELGFACHKRFGGTGSADDEGQVLSTSLLVLALLLGFTFSMALERYDERRGMVVQESNDIGTVWLRAGLLPAPHGTALQAKLTQYAILRQDSPLPHETARLARAQQLRDEIWAIAAQAQPALDGARAALLLNAVGTMLDTGNSRERAVAAQVPAPVILMLVLFSSVSCFLLGYLLDAHGHRHRLASTILFLLMGLTIMLILELDRPAEGLIVVDQSAMRDLARQLANSLPVSQN